MKKHAILVRRKHDYDEDEDQSEEEQEEQIGEIITANQVF
jgi:hypothetical protein